MTIAQRRGGGRYIALRLLRCRQHKKVGSKKRNGLLCVRILRCIFVQHNMPLTQRPTLCMPLCARHVCRVHIHVYTCHYKFNCESCVKLCTPVLQTCSTRAFGLRSAPTQGVYMSGAPENATPWFGAFLDQTAQFCHITKLVPMLEAWYQSEHAVALIHMHGHVWTSKGHAWFLMSFGNGALLLPLFSKK